MDGGDGWSNNADSRKFSFLLFITIVVACAEAAKLTHAQASKKLRAAGIKWRSSGGCSDRNKKTCTSFDRVNSATIDAVITLKKACNCPITITGGTETGHASGTYSHWNGYKLDLAKNSALNNYITRNFKRIANRGDGSPQYKAKSGNIYAVSFLPLYLDLFGQLTIRVERRKPLGQHFLQ